MTAEFARQLSRPPPNTSKEIWLYELGRFLIQKTNAIIVALFADSPPCNPHTCPEMRASEWQYLCAVHDPPKSCSAIDYCCHTLDWAATTLTSSKMFPSRLGLGSGNVTGTGSDKVLQQQMKEITNIFRRVYRIYAHAWFQHRDMFWRVEGKTGLYILFKTVCDEYGMIQPENYTIPPEAEGIEPELTPQVAEPSQPLSLLRRDPETEEEKPSLPEPAGNKVLSLGDTTKRHRQTRSDVGTSLKAASIQEEAEEEDDGNQASKPSLDRHTTALKDVKDEPSEPTVPKEETSAEEADAPEASLARSDTIKAPKESEAEEETEDVTVIEAATESNPDDANTAESKDEPAEVKKEEETAAEEEKKPAAEETAAD